LFVNGESTDISINTSLCFLAKKIFGVHKISKKNESKTGSETGALYKLNYTKPKVKKEKATFD